MLLSSCYILCRFLHFISLMSLAGAGIYTALLAPVRLRASLSQSLMPLIMLSCWLTLVTALLLLLLTCGLMGDGWSDTLKGDIWLAVWQTRFGRVWQWQLIFATAGCLALALRGQRRQKVLLLCALAQLGGMSFTGHALMLDGWQGALQRINQLVHLLAATFWAGGLLPLVLLMRAARDITLRDDAVRTMMRFSRYGHLAVGLVLISGMLNALLLLGWPVASFTLYSQLLAVKIVLVAIMIAMALFNRYWLVPGFQRGGERVRHKFITVSIVEIFLAAAVLLIVSGFATLEPGPADSHTGTIIDLSEMSHIV